MKEIFSISLIICFLALRQVESDLKHFHKDEPIVCLDTYVSYQSSADQGQRNPWTKHELSCTNEHYGERVKVKGDCERRGSWESVPSKSVEQLKPFLNSLKTIRRPARSIPERVYKSRLERVSKVPGSWFILFPLPGPFSVLHFYLLFPWLTFIYSSSLILKLTSSGILSKAPQARARRPQTLSSHPVLCQGSCLQYYT